MIDSDAVSWISRELNLAEGQIRPTLAAIESGATTPFLARYRKEETGGLDEVEIEDIRKKWKSYQELTARKEYILTTIAAAGALSEDLKNRIEVCYDLQVLEDLYLPFKPKRKTKATIAREKGLEPLAIRLFRQQGQDDPEYLAKRYVGAEVESVEAALQGARDIIAEWIAEDERVRKQMRFAFERGAMLQTKLVKGKEEEGKTYRDYFSHTEALARIPSHRLLAIRRAEEEGIIRVSIKPDESRTLPQLERLVLKGRSSCTEQVAMALSDAYSRLLQPSFETEFRNSSKRKADEAAILIFSQNLRELLMAPPLGEKRILAIDPGFRTGCKWVCLDAQGALLEDGVIYPHPPQNKASEAEKDLAYLIDKYQMEAIAIGNGTAGRETQSWIASLADQKKIDIYMVNEAGASIYSASEIARQEFPDKDITVRGAVSIGRRLMDPLAELVKIDPKSIGVGQYQHDVDPKLLKEGLDQTVVSCVNAVGVQVNTASASLLTYVAGLGPALAQAIVRYRETYGPFESREALKKVPRLGANTFEQCAGFLRIRDAENPLDNTAVHPERYTLVKKMAKDQGMKLEVWIQESNIRRQLPLKQYVSGNVGLPTLEDIMKELDKPGLDPRGQASPFHFASVKSLEDLHIGMHLPGIVNNLTAFGAFVDVGIKQSGMVHISQITDKFIKSPSEVLHVGQQVEVRVLSIDFERGRLALSMLP